MTSKLWLKPEWPAPANVHAATTCRSGGFSQGCYASLNLARHVGDDATAVSQNRALLSKLLGLPAEPSWLSQIHSAIAVEASHNMPLMEADASYTAQTGVVCVVMTADCLPVLLCSQDGAEIAAIHAGWRGLLDGIIDNTVKAMQKRDMMAWLGPAIGPNCFEVGDEVRAAFVARSREFQPGFAEGRKGKWLADIYRLARINLAQCGITRVYGGDFCTVTEKDKFFSFRRDKTTGRMATLIWRD